MDRRTKDVLSSTNYWEIREGSASNRVIRVSNAKVKDLSMSAAHGLSVRVLKNGSWGFFYGEGMPLLDIAKRAVSLARASDGSVGSIANQPRRKNSFKTKMKTNPDDISSEEIVKSFRRHHVSSVNSTSFDFQSNERVIEFSNCEGSHLSQTLNYVTAGANIGVKSGAKNEEFDARVGGLGGYEIVRNGFGHAVNEAVSRAKELLIARVPKGGSFPVVCDPVLVDVLVHEAFGHGAEADLVLKGESCLADKLGKQLAGRDITIVDDSTIPGAWGSFFFDDEGVRAKKTTILDKGILSNFMHSRETASEMDCEPTGNARAEGVSTVPAVRMSNTNLLPKKASTEELLEGIRSGLFLGGSAGGQVDTAKGNFQFNSKFGYRIVNGELGAPIKGVSLSGNTLTLLDSIDAVGRKKSAGLPGFCGKFGQMVPVIGINPSLRLKKAMVGGRI